MIQICNQLPNPIPDAFYQFDCGHTAFNQHLVQRLRKPPSTLLFALAEPVALAGYLHYVIADPWQFIAKMGNQLPELHHVKEVLMLEMLGVSLAFTRQGIATSLVLGAIHVAQQRNIPLLMASPLHETSENLLRGLEFTEVAAGQLWAIRV